MSIQAILMPMFAQVALTFVLLFWMTILRLRVIRKGEVRPQQVALREPAWPPHVIQVGNAFHNQLELPMLFYVLIAFILITKAEDALLLILAWIFVLSRIVHAFIHTTGNVVDRRFMAYSVGVLVLLLMWVIFAAKIVTGA